jgi:hypothetical protein
MAENQLAALARLYTDDGIHCEETDGGLVLRLTPAQAVQLLAGQDCEDLPARVDGVRQYLAVVGGI